MKTQFLLAGMLLAGTITANAQNVVSSPNLTSGGSGAGYMATKSAFYGVNAGYSTLGERNTFVGFEAGKVNNSGAGNTFLGAYAGWANTTGGSNLFAGTSAGSANTSGGGNVFLGPSAGVTNTTGGGNIFIGSMTGLANTSGSHNIRFGSYSGSDGATGSYNITFGYNSGSHNSGSENIAIGYNSGNYNNGSQNIFIGKNAGNNTSGSNQIFIDNVAGATPLIYGDFTNDLVKLNGKVGIDMGTAAFPANAVGVSLTDYRLFVNGGILAKQVRVATTWADYVFNDDYNLAPLSEVEQYIAQNGHLPNVPSAKQVEDEGMEVGEMTRIQQEKIEELTLYAIAQDKKLSEQEKQLNGQAEKIARLEMMVQQLMDK